MSLVDIAKPIFEVLSEYDIEWQELMALGAEELGAILDDMPTRRADMHLHAQVLRNPTLKPKRTDLNDWSALVPAAIYCDVVVSEKHFADLLLRDDFDPELPF